MRHILTALFLLLLTLPAGAASGAKSKVKAVDRAQMVKPLSLRTAHRVMRKAEQTDTVDLYITGSYTFYLDYDDEEETSDWFFCGKDQTGFYEVRLDYPGTLEGKYGTYTYDDLDRDFSYIKDTSTGELEYRNYQPGTVFTVSDNDGKLHIEGTLVCDNGVVYRLHMEHTPQSYYVEGTELTDIYYFEEDTDWYMRFQNDHFRISLDLNTGDESTFTGTYTEDDAVSGYNFVTDLKEGGTDFFSTLNVTLTMPEGITDPTVAFEVTGTALTEHGDTVHFHMRKNPPIDPIRSVQLGVDLQQAEWPSRQEDCKCYFQLTETDAPHMQWNLAFQTLLGRYNETVLVDSLTYRINNTTGAVQHVDNGKLSLTFDASTRSVNLTAALVMPDSVEYCFQANYPITIKGEESLSFSNISVNNDYYEDLGTQWIDASNDEATIEMTLTNADIPGDYTDDNASFEMAVTDDDGEISAVNSIAVIYASTKLDEHNQPLLDAQFLASNMKIYTIDAHLDLPAITDTLYISVDHLKAYDLISTMGLFQIYGYNSDSTVYVAIAPQAAQFAGHYTTADLAAYRNYSFLALRQADGTYDKKPFYTADFDVERRDDEVTLTGTFRTGSHIVHLTLQATIREQGIDYDSEDDDLNVAFTTADLKSLEKGDGYAYVELQNEQRSDIFSMLLYLDFFDNDITIPVGTYQVSDTYMAPSVQPGQVYDGNLYPTFYATVGDNGYLYTPFWFLVSGTVTVKKTSDGNLSFVVDGLNSYSRTLHVTYNADATAIRSAQSDKAILSRAKKFISKGYVVISKDGRTYSLDH